MARTAADRGNSAQDVLEMSYGYNAQGVLVHRGKYITPEVIAGMEQLQKQKDAEAVPLEDLYDVEEVVVATGELYKPE